MDDSSTNRDTRGLGLLHAAPGLGPSPIDPRFSVDLHDRAGQRCLRSLVAFPAEAVLTPFVATTVHARPARMTIQVSERDHIELGPPFLQLINHACDPSAAFDVVTRTLVALRPIAPGDEITYFYPSTEWTMAAPFDCDCGSPRCLRRITGASELPEAALRGHRLAPHVVRLRAADRSRVPAQE